MGNTQATQAVTIIPVLSIAESDSGDIFTATLTLRTPHDYRALRSRIYLVASFAEADRAIGLSCVGVNAHGETVVSVVIDSLKGTRAEAEVMLAVLARAAKKAGL